MKRCQKRCRNEFRGIGSPFQEDRSLFCFNVQKEVSEQVPSRMMDISLFKEKKHWKVKGSLIQEREEVQGLRDTE